MAVSLIFGAPCLAPAAEARFQPVCLSPARAGPAGPPQQPRAVGTGQVKVGLILPLSAAGNAGVAAQSMKNAAEMALAEFQSPNVQLLVKDDAGNAARRAAGDRSRRSTRAPRSSWARCSPHRCRRPRRSRARAACR